MNFLQNIKDSIETSVSIKLFYSLNIASYNHIFHSKFCEFPISKCKQLQNFNPLRLSNNPYPKEDRPRGQKDLDSLRYHRRYIRKHGHTEPIWIALKDSKYILLDGAHRIVSTYLENKISIPCYIVKIN